MTPAFLVTLAQALHRVRDEFGGCDGCDGVFDYEYTAMARGAELTFCPSCYDELTARHEGSMDEVGMW